MDVDVVADVDVDMDVAQKKKNYKYLINSLNKIRNKKYKNKYTIYLGLPTESQAWPLPTRTLD